MGTGTLQEMRVTLSLLVMLVLGTAWASGQEKGEGLPEDDPVAEKMVAEAKEEEADDEVEIKPENMAENTAELPTMDEALNETVQAEIKEQNAKAKAGDKEGRFGRVRPTKIIRKWTKPRSKYVSKISWGTTRVTKRYYSYSSWGSSGFSVSGSSGIWGNPTRIPKYLQGI